MKKLILITSVFLSTSLWASPMDKVCFFEGSGLGFSTNLTKQDKLKNSCERNNILQVVNTDLTEVTFLVNHYCRFDRNIYVQERKPYPREVNDKGTSYDFGCVLYDNKPREPIEGTIRIR